MFTAKRFSGVEVFINLLLKKKGEGGQNSQCRSNSCEISFKKEELYLHKKWHVGT